MFKSLFCYLLIVSLIFSLTEKTSYGIFSSQCDSINQVSCKGKSVPINTFYCFKMESGSDTSYLEHDNSFHLVGSLHIGSGAKSFYRKIKLIANDLEDKLYYVNDGENNIQTFIDLKATIADTWTNDLFFPPYQSKMNLKDKAYNINLNDTVYRFRIIVTNANGLPTHIAYVSEIGVSKKYGIVYMVEGGLFEGEFMNYNNACVVYYQPPQNFSLRNDSFPETQYSLQNIEKLLDSLKKAKDHYELKLLETK